MSRKSIILIVAGVIGVIGLVLAIFLVTKSIQGKSAEIAELNLQVEDLSWQVDAYGDIVEVYTVISTKKSGEIFDQTDIDVLAIPSSQVSDQFVTDVNELKNAIYKIDVEPGMPLTKGLFFREVLTQTDRYYDTVADLFPVGARKGDFYDLRLVTPNGLDYIVLSKKRAVDFYGSAVRFVMSEEEIHQYQSSLVDVFINPGTYLYATTYVEPALQKRASIYYPVSDLVRAVMEIDPNIVQLAEQDLIAKRRAAFEKGLEIDEDRSTAIVAGRSEQIARIVDAAQSLIEANSAPQAPSDGTETETGATDPGTGNLMSPGATTSEQEEQSTPNTSAEQKTQDTMKFEENPVIVPEGLPAEVDKTGGW